MVSKNINFAQLANTLQAGVYRSTNGNKARFIYTNSTLQAMLGYSAKKMTGMVVADIFSDQRKYEVFQKMLSQDKRVRDFEVRLRGRGSKAFWCTISGNYVTEGKDKWCDVVVTDITLRKKCEKAVLESKELFQTVFKNTAAAIMVANPQDRIVAWNPYTEKLIGLTKEELFNKDVKELYPAKEWHKIHNFRKRRNGILPDIQTQVYKSDGKLLDVHISISVLKDTEGNKLGSIGIMQNITEQKKYEDELIQAKMAAEQANSAKSLFLANMSHEVRTPMNTIMGMIDITLDSELTAEQKENLSLVKDAAVNLLGLLNDILDLSKVEAGKVKLECIEFHLPNVARSICKGLSVLAKGKSLELLLNIDSGVPELIEGDPVRLRQILVNLINNAIKFTHKGKITISVAVVSKAADSVVLQFAVTDEGIGIPKDKQGTVFNVFTQADESTTRRFGGTGLGLAICKRLVEMMDGRIWVDSVETKGSTFNFTARFKVLKWKVVAEDPALKPDNKFKDEDFKGLKILLAEDNVVNQKIAVRMLEKIGCKMDTAVNGKEVVDKVLTGSYNLVLMDAHMPEMDGLEATRVIRKNEEKTGTHIPIIALTARAMNEDRMKCLDAGMDGYVSKPIERDKMFQEIANVLKKRTES